jgi:hypothetical protein
MTSPLAIASGRRLRMIAAFPSPREYPFARESKLYDRPSFERKFMLLRDRKTSGDSKRFEPPTSAWKKFSPDANHQQGLVLFGLTMFESLLRNPWHATSSAIILLEHAESKLTLGPFKLKNQLILFARTARDVPVAW